MKQRDIILVPFPFSDQTGRKVRPALIVSNDNYNETNDDVIVCAITTVLKPSKYAVVIEQKDIEEGILYQKSTVKTENILKINKNIIIKKITSLKKETFSKITDILEEIFKQK